MVQGHDAVRAFKVEDARLTGSTVQHQALGLW